jgi:hypothetical protein
MDKEYVPYEQALELKELGFDEPCFGWYSSKENNPLRFGICKTYLGIETCSKAPLYQQAFKWFREKHNIDISINTIYSKYNENTSKKYGGAIDNGSVFTNVGFYDTYEEAELACLKKLIEIVKNK